MYACTTMCMHMCAYYFDAISKYGVSKYRGQKTASQNMARSSTVV